MARDTQSTPKQENAQQGSQTTGGTRTEPSRPSDDRGERERSVATTRESPAGRSSQSTAVGRGTTRGPIRTFGSDPFLLMRRMSEDMDRLFENFGFGRAGLGLTPFGGSIERSPWSASSALTGQDWSPQVETFRKGDKLVVRADLPGLSKDNVNVEVEDGVLTIDGERSEQNEEDRDDYYRSERSYGRFYRAIPLPDGVNADACEANFKDGVLEVTFPLPKQEERKAKRISIR